MVRTAGSRDFDVQALYDALDQRRVAEGVSWSSLAKLMWQESEVLNHRLGDHPISSATITNLPRRGDAGAQHALVMLRWLGRAPEDFIAEPRPGTLGAPLPAADPAHRLRWDLHALHDALNAARAAREATWEQTAERLRCTASQLTGLRTVKFGTSMRLAMRICQALGRPAADFVFAAEW